MNLLQVKLLIFSYFCLPKSQAATGNITIPPRGLDPTVRDCPSDTVQASGRLVFLKFPHKVLPDSYAFVIKQNQIITLASFIALENVYMISANCIRMRSKAASRLYAQRRIAHPQYANTRRSYDIAIIIVDYTTGFNENFAVATDFDMSFKNNSCFLFNENISSAVYVTTVHHNDDKHGITYLSGSNDSGIVLCCGKLLGFTLHDPVLPNKPQRIQTFTKLHDFIKAPEFYAPYIDGLTNEGAIMIFSAGSIVFSITFRFLFN